jgi:DNA repair protein RadC
MARPRTVSPLVARLHDAGVDALSDAELVALVQGAPEPSLASASALLDAHGGVASLSRAGVGSLRPPSRGDAERSARVVAAFELGRRAARVTLDPGAPLGDGRAVAAWAKGRLGSLEHEELWVIATDGRHRPRAARMVARGGLSSVAVLVRDPLRVALREGASALLLVHNHPAGDPTPSLEDLRFTHALAAAAEVVGTPLLDHVIVAGDRHVSLLDLGLLEASPQRRRQGLSRDVCTLPAHLVRVPARA